VRIISSSEYYDQLSADYRQISQSRTAYLAGIDRLIAESLRPGLSLLDVGGVDGVRARRLAHDAGISRVTLLDSSPAMLSRVEPKNFEQIIEEGQASGVFQPSIDPKIATYGLLGMCNWLSQWYRPEGQYSPQQIAAMFENMVRGFNI